MSMLNTALTDWEAAIVDSLVQSSIWLDGLRHPLLMLVFPLPAYIFPQFYEIKLMDILFIHFHSNFRQHFFLMDKERIH